MQDGSVPYQKRHRARGYLLSLVLLLIGSGAGAYLYHSQQAKVESTERTNAALHSQLGSLNSQLASAKAAANISTSSWKSYCDPYRADFCFKYPADWMLARGNLDQYMYATATATNPDKSLTLEYVNPYIKDGFPENFIPYSATPITVDGNTLSIIGGYYVEAVEHTPIYAITNVAANTVKPGQVMDIGTGPVFSYDNGSQTAQISIFPSGTQDFSTTAQANAWFTSVNGKTALAILETLSAK